MATKRDPEDEVMVDELEAGGGKPAPSSGAANAIQSDIVQPEKTGARQFLGKVFRYPASRLDTVALGDDAGSKRPRGLQQRGAAFCIGHRCLPARPAAAEGCTPGATSRVVAADMLRRPPRAE